MNDFRQSSLPQRDYAAQSQLAQNRALLSTYSLLALPLTPTGLSATAVLNTGLNSVMAAIPGTSIIVFLIGAFGLMYLVERNKNSSLGVMLLLAFTFFMGLMLSRLVGFVLGFSNG